MIDLSIATAARISQILSSMEVNAPGPVRHGISLIAVALRDASASFDETDRKPKVLKIRVKL